MKKLPDIKENEIEVTNEEVEEVKDYQNEIKLKMDKFLKRKVNLIKFKTKKTIDINLKPETGKMDEDIKVKDESACSVEPPEKVDGPKVAPIQLQPLTPLHNKLTS